MENVVGSINLIKYAKFDFEDRKILIIFGAIFKLNYLYKSPIKFKEN